MAQLLLENGADVNAKNNDSNTPLDWLNKNNKNDPDHEATKAVLEEAEETRFGKTLAELFLLSSPIFVLSAPPSAFVSPFTFGKPAAHQNAFGQAPAPFGSTAPSCGQAPAARPFGSSSRTRTSKPGQAFSFGSTAAHGQAPAAPSPSAFGAAPTLKPGQTFNFGGTLVPSGQAPVPSGGLFGAQPAPAQFGQPVSAETGSKRIGTFVRQLEVEVTRVNTTDIDALRALGYCHDHGIQVQQDSKRALELYLRSDAVSKQQPVNNRHKEWGTESCAAWLHKINDPRVAKFETRAELEHHVQNLTQLVDVAKSSVDVEVLEAAVSAPKEIPLLKGLFELEAFRSLENMQEELEALRQKANSTQDIEEKIPIAKKIQSLQERCREEEKKQASLGIAKKVPPEAHPPQKASGSQHAEATPPATAADLPKQIEEAQELCREEEKKQAPPATAANLPEQIEKAKERCQEEEKKQAGLGIAKKAPPEAHPPQKDSGYAEATPPATDADPTGADPFDVYLVHTGVDKRTVVIDLKKALSSAPKGCSSLPDVSTMSVRELVETVGELRQELEEKGILNTPDQFREKHELVQALREVWGETDTAASASET